MTYDQYWHEDPYLARAYAQAYLLKRKTDNENMWIQGAYMANAMTVAIANTFGKKQHEYLKKPLELFPKTEAEQKEEVREKRRRIFEKLLMVQAAFTSKRKAKTGVDQSGKP